MNFWRSVWRIPEGENPPVARFEWTIKPYAARFLNTRYLDELTFLRFLDLFNYAALAWGRLCIPDPQDRNRARWELAPIWAQVRDLIAGFTQHHGTAARRDYELRPDLNDAYLNSAAGWIGGLMARLGIENEADRPSTVIEAFTHLESNGFTMVEKARQKFDRFNRLMSGGELDE